MTLQGHIENGSVILDEVCHLPDGTSVTVLPQMASEVTELPDHVRLALELSATVPEEDWEELPRDGARNLDHYLYGAPKKPE